MRLLTQEMTAYYANVLPEYMRSGGWSICFCIVEPAIRDSDFVNEKKVILEEVAMYLDDPGHRL